MPEFLRHYGMRNGRNVRKGDIYTAAKLEFEKLRTSDEVRDSLADMKSAALAYQKFLYPTEETDPRIERRLLGILELDSTVFYPLLIRLYRLWEREQVCIDDLLGCLDLLESFYVRRLVCGVPTNALNKITLELCLNLPSAKPDIWLQERLTHGSGSRRCPTDQEFFEALVVQRLYPRRKIARYMLIALEEAHQHKEPVETAAATMEHVMPQTLSDDWKVSLGGGYAEIHDRWLDTLGNLTLTGYNSELSNGTFEDKKVRLQNTHFELSRSLLSQSRWGPDQIEARGKALAEIALGRWRMG